MAQGMKKFAQSAHKSKKHHRLPVRKTGPKKGRIDIAPKKTKLLEEKKWKKCLQRDIQHNIEQEISKKASAVEPKSFTIFKPVDSGSSVNKKKLNK
ncbi:leydig cell tumor 10 kDa protein homolog isoform X2 [Haliotis rufescens]|uniref:leydig cell tumor 10 kDa protein homolog isoform X2 n=1 Tax=Haliotis rufescens TaxID=6454 RepID=UPI001EAFCD46|nr:leydig cell tumor 10 kDa protein homolog isoform X2 [Haliotis rufescens]